MGDLFRRAVSEVAALSDEAQDEIGRQMLDYLERRAALQAEIEKGIASLDAGRGRPLDLDDFLKRMHARGR